MLPRPLLWGAAALVLLALLAAGGARLAPGGDGAEPAPAALQSRDLFFEDRTDGGIDVRDARDRRVVEVIAAGTNGFLRGALRGLARERKRHGLGAEIPFRVAVRSDAHLVLEDPATRRRVDLGSFGPANSGAFARLLQAGSAGT
jgi:putative photosynthetic complex assembly protein